MLTASFSCFKGLSISSERKIWELGCLSWEQFNYLPKSTFSAKKTAVVRSEIEQARIALKGGMVDYFLNRFTNPDKVRVLSEFQNRSAIIDIETTGLTSKDEITCIAVLKHGEISLFVKNINLSGFLETLQGVNLLITYNGTRFDIPFIRKSFGIDLAIPHLDLMPVLKQLGYAGGQKKCEELLRLKRTHSSGVRGEDAIFLWDGWQRYGNRADLDQLMLYNAEDVFMLEKLAVKSYNRVMRNSPLGSKLKSGFPSRTLKEAYITNFAL